MLWKDMKMVLFWEQALLTISSMWLTMKMPLNKQALITLRLLTICFFRHQALPIMEYCYEFMKPRIRIRQLKRLQIQIGLI